MKKIPTLFERDWQGDRSRVINQINPACQWVIDGEGVATQKIDGACCMVRDGKLFKRREFTRQALKGKPYPPGFELADADEVTGKVVGWLPVGDDPEDKWFREALDATNQPADGTYELIGPKVQGNPENWAKHSLWSHDALQLTDQPPRDFDGLRAWMDGKDIEGVVWHHPDGRRAKLKLRDFGLNRRAK